MISNTNGLIKWDKISCNKYAVTNYSAYTVNINIISQTNDYTYSLAAESNAKVEFEVPCDGVYKICVDGCNEIVTVVDSTTVNVVESRVSVFTFAGAEPIDFEILRFNGNTIYDKFINGAADTATPANLTAVLNSVLGAGFHELVAPNVTPTLFPELGTSTSWRLILRHLTQEATSFQVRDAALVRNTYTPSLYCHYEAQPPLAPFIIAGQNWITSLVIDGLDVMALPTSPFWKRYDALNSDHILAFISHATTYINSVFGYTLYAVPGSSFMIPDRNDHCCCPKINTITVSELEIECEPIVWCDYLYELCALYTCITAKVRDLMCQNCDPCRDDCSQETVATKKKAREDLLYISTLFWFSLVPMITKDRLNYMGDLVIDEARIECTMKLIEVYEKIVEFAKKCGECEECQKVDDCGCGCNQNNSQNSGKCHNCH